MRLGNERRRGAHAVLAVLRRLAGGPAARCSGIALLAPVVAGMAVGDGLLRGPHLTYYSVFLLLIASTAGWLAVVRYLRRAEEQRIAMMLDAAPEAIIGVEDSGKIRFANARVAELFGYTEAELVDEPIERLIPDRFHAAHVGFRAGYVQEPRARPMARASALLAKGKEGREFPVEVSLSRIPNGREPFILCVVRDVSEQRRIREALLQANRELESTVAAMRRRTHELGELTRLAELLQSCVSEREIYPLASDALARLFPGVSGGLYLLNPSRNLAELAGSWSCSQEHCLGSFAPQDCWALRRGRAHHCASGDTVLRCSHISPEVGRRESLCIPMAAQGETIGVLCAWGRPPGEQEPGAFDQVLRAFAEQCALAVANLRLREALRCQSIRDALTGLFNRRFLDEWLERELRRSVRQGSRLSVLMIDIDHFKRFNDTFGHQSGDHALRESCMLLQRSARSSDVVCRMGGEEIAVLLPDTALEGALQVAEQLRGAVEQNVVRRQSATLGSLTISIGVACSTDHGVTSETLLEAADIALYAAKREGRNRVVSAARPDLAGHTQVTWDAHPARAADGTTRVLGASALE